MTTNENIKIKIIDIATMLTIGGILLFNLGWTYWSSYYKTFNIDASFIDITFDKIIVTTWYFVLLAISFFYFAFNHIFESRQKKKVNILTAFLAISDSISLLVCLIMKLNYWWILISFGISLIIVLIAALILNKLKISQDLITLKVFKYILIVVIYMCSIFLYYNMGKTRANLFISDYSENIELTLNKDKLLINGKIITFMKNKYFILTKKNNKIEVLVLNESEVLQARLK